MSNADNVCILDEFDASRATSDADQRATLGIVPTWIIYSFENGHPSRH